MALTRDNAGRPVAACTREHKLPRLSGKHRGPVSTLAIRLCKLIGVGVVLGNGAACATKFSEEVIYPDRIAALDTLPRLDVAESEITIQIDAPVQQVWDALLAVLVQHAFISRIDTSDPRARRLGYVDYTMLMLDEKLVHVALPFNVTVWAREDGSSAIQMLCRWDLVASDSYREARPERYETLSASMLAEGYLLIARVEKQATAHDSWRWLNRKGSQ